MLITISYYFMRMKGLAARRERGGFPTVGTLVQARKLALRRGIWFKILNRIERGIIDLTAKYVDNIKSEKLAQVVGAIMDKLEFAVESIVDRLVRTVGVPLARKISDIALRWGNHLASIWAKDLRFARFLAFTFGRAQT